MSFETQTPQPENRRNYDIGRREIHLNEGAEVTVPAANFMAIASEVQAQYGIDTPLSLKAVVNPDDQSGGDRPVMIFDTDNDLAQGDVLFAIAQEDLSAAGAVSGKDHGLTLDDLRDYVRWIAPGRSVEFGQFAVGANQEGDVSIISRSPAGIDVTASVPPQD